MPSFAEQARRVYNANRRMRIVENAVEIMSNDGIDMDRGAGGWMVPPNGNLGRPSTQVDEATENNWGGFNPDVCSWCPPYCTTCGLIKGTWDYVQLGVRKDCSCCGQGLSRLRDFIDASLCSRCSARFPSTASQSQHCTVFSPSLGGAGSGYGNTYYQEPQMLNYDGSQQPAAGSAPTAGSSVMPEHTYIAHMGRAHTVPVTPAPHDGPARMYTTDQSRFGMYQPNSGYSNGQQGDMRQSAPPQNFGQPGSYMPRCSRSDCIAYLLGDGMKCFNGHAQ